MGHGLERVTEPTKWVSPVMVTSKPNGGLRICIAPKDLNQSVKRQHFAVPSAEELIGRLSKVKYYAVLDATSGFYQILARSLQRGNILQITWTI